jgi:IS1 family transposase
MGSACAAYQDATLRDLRCTRFEADAIWSFCYVKAKNVPEEHRDEYGYGDVWTWTAICADSKLVPSWLVGEPTAEDAYSFMLDLRSRVSERIPWSADGYRLYVRAVDEPFGPDVDFAQILKIYGAAPATTANERRYNPAIGTGADNRVIMADPDLPNVSTSYVERRNLSTRTGLRRFTRLTNALSKKIENLAHAVSLHYMYYNLAHPHTTLTKAAHGYPTTPAMAAGKADHVWTLTEIAGLLD